MPWRDDLEDEPDWSEEDPADWPDEDGEFLTVECPNCQAEVHEDTPRCPFCGEYITPQSRTGWKHKPLWFVWLALLGIIAVLLTMLLP